MQPQNHNTIDDEIKEINEKKTLIKAARNQNVILVQSILKIGADVNVQDENGSTPLHIVSENGNAPIADLLLRFGAKVNIQNSKNETPIYFAVINRHFEVVEKLLANGADLNVEDEPLLHLAIDKYIGQPNLQIVKKLIDYGANIETQDQDGRSPLRLALVQKNDQIIKLLLMNGAEFSTGTFLMLSLKGDPEIVQIMIDKGANVELYGLLACVASLGHLEVLKLLIKYGADVNESSYHSPLHKAVDNNHKEIVYELLKNGANANLQDRNGNTPIHMGHFSPEALKVLLKEGNNLHLEIRNHNGQTPFEFFLGGASRRNLKEVVRIMLLAKHQNN